MIQKDKKIDFNTALNKVRQSHVTKLDISICEKENKAVS